MAVKCRWCKKDITKADVPKMVTAHRQPDGSEAVNVPSEGISASGPLLWAAHYREYKFRAKREMRGGDAVAGGKFGDALTAYDVAAMAQNQDDVKESGTSEMTTAFLAERAVRARREAAKLGGSSEDLALMERRRAEAHGGPYAHKHVTPLIGYGLAAHLRWAHGVEESVVRGMSQDERASMHGVAHVQEAQKRTQEDRAQDLGYQEPVGRDWRDQTVAEVEDLQ